MVAASDLRIPRREGELYSFPVAAGERFFKKAIVALNAAGQALPAGTVGAIKLIGLASLHVDNRDGLAGDETVEAEKGAFNMPLAGATIANIGDVVYAADDNTLQLTNAGGELPLGTIEAIDADGVWIRI